MLKTPGVIDATSESCEITAALEVDPPVAVEYDYKGQINGPQ